jgi:thiamine kinase-like enzyme
MNRAIKYFHNTIIPKYCDEKYYTKTNYLNNITVYTENNLYDVIVKLRLISPFYDELILLFKEFTVEIPGDIKITGNVNKLIITFNFKSTDYLNPAYLYESFVCGNDPLYDSNIKNNKSRNKFEIKYLRNLVRKNFEPNSPESSSNIMESLDFDNITIIKENNGKFICKNDKYVIKCLSTAYTDNELYHEALIYYMIHKYTKLPNFAKFISISDIENTAQLWKYGMDARYKVTSLILENVHADKLMDVIAYLSEKHFKLMLKQIIYCIYHLYITFEFTHYDLHMGNILFKKLDHEISIQYINDIIFTDVLIYFVDFEFSYLKLPPAEGELNNRNIGIHMDGSNIFNYSFWIHDMFKVLMCIFIKIYNLKNERSKNKHSMNGGNTTIHRDFQGVDDNSKSEDLEIHYTIISKLLKFFVGACMDEELASKYNNVNEFMNLRCFPNDLNFTDFISYFDKIINE